MPSLLFSFALTACQPAPNQPQAPPVIVQVPPEPRPEPAPAPPPPKDDEGFTMVMGPDGTMIKVKTKDIDVKVSK